MNPAISALIDRVSGGDASEVERRIERFRELLLDANARVNLLSRREPETTADELLYDSLAIFRYLSLKPDERLLDIGSGGGIPGLVHKIIRPDIKLISVDSNRRKIEFQRRAVTALALNGVTLHWSRIEELPPLDADLAVAKAVASVEQLCRWAAPHLRTGGRLVLPRGLSESRAVAESLPPTYRLEGQLEYESSPSRRRSYLLLLQKS